MSRDKERVEWQVLQMVSLVDGGPPDWRMLQSQRISISNGRKVLDAARKKGHVFVDSESPSGTRGEKIMGVRLTDQGLERLEQLDKQFAASLS